MATVSRLVSDYVEKHSSVQECLQDGLINYSALARQIKKETKSPASVESFLIAARRLKNQLQKENRDDAVINLLKKSTIETKNRIQVYTVDKDIMPEKLLDIEKTIKKNKDMIFIIEGTRTITIIIEQKYTKDIEKIFRYNFLEKKKDLCLITISSKGIGRTQGVVHFLTGLFNSRGINIEEFISCFDDTLIIIRSKDLAQVLDFMHRI